MLVHLVLNPCVGAQTSLPSAQECCDATGFLCGLFSGAHLILGTGCPSCMGQALCSGWCRQLWGAQAVSGTHPTPGGRPPAPCSIFSCCHVGITPPRPELLSPWPGASSGSWGLLGFLLGCINTQNSLTQLLQSLSCCPRDGITLPLLQADVLGCSLPALLANFAMKH